MKEVCIACKDPVDKCICFGEKPLSKFEYLNRKKRGQTPRTHGYHGNKINVHGNSGYVAGCRCDICFAGHKAYFEANKEKIRAKRRAYYQAQKGISLP